MIFSQVPDMLSIAGYIIICAAAIINFILTRRTCEIRALLGSLFVIQ